MWSPVPASRPLLPLLPSPVKEVGPKGIRVNTVSPRPVATDLWLGDDGVGATVARASGGDPTNMASARAAQSVTVHPAPRNCRPSAVDGLVSPTRRPD
jgi:NAD(P)-dependent dehydrogenase (short-subunit alcohol dehydrogenase family)